MKKKTVQKNKAIELRKEGLSIKKIAKELNVSVGSIHTWVYDITLTTEQKDKLKKNSSESRIGNKSKRDWARQSHSKFQEEGKEIAKQNNMFHAMGCMLYWGEGNKTKHCGLTNSDPNMIKFFLQFLKEFYQVPENKIKIQINCYTNNGLFVEEIESYWLDFLSLPRSCLHATMVNKKPCSSKSKRPKLLYGVVQLRVCDTKLLHSILGSVQEYKKIWQIKNLFQLATTRNH